MAAPASPHASAAAAISSGVVGTFGFWAFVGQEPVVAALMIKAFAGQGWVSGRWSLMGGLANLIAQAACRLRADYTGLWREPQADEGSQTLPRSSHPGACGDASTFSDCQLRPTPLPILAP